MYHYHTDHLGSAQTITNWRGEIHERLEYAYDDRIQKAAIGVATGVGSMVSPVLSRGATGEPVNTDLVRELSMPAETVFVEFGNMGRTD